MLQVRAWAKGQGRHAQLQTALNTAMSNKKLPPQVRKVFSVASFTAGVPVLLEEGCKASCGQGPLPALWLVGPVPDAPRARTAVWAVAVWPASATSDEASLPSISTHCLPAVLNHQLFIVVCGFALLACRPRSLQGACFMS